MITYLTGDATEPVQRPALIIHVCNDIGGWGRGFVLALSRRWSEPERVYRSVPKDALRLGQVHFAQAEPDIYVANMIAQHGIHSENGVPPIRYEALHECLVKVAHWLSVVPTLCSVHAPRIGCGLAGGEWGCVEDLLLSTLPQAHIFVYDLPTRKI